MSVLWSDLTASELNAAARAGALVFLPVASTEQHGPHLATGVDTLLCGEVCRRAAQRIVADGGAALVAPTVWPGLAEHHVSFGGTFTLSIATWTSLIGDLLSSIARAGFREVVIVNGHGGNIAALNAFTGAFTRDSGLSLRSCSYFVLAETAFAAVLEDQTGVLHACEAETSMMLAAFPTLVREKRLGEAFGPNPTGPTASVLAAPMQRWRPFAEITDTGVIGDARRANAAKGERLLTAAAEALARAAHAA